ncbi:MAG: beta-glucosidase [Abitibacteriaceae bacterium]|nr:beta-glucosidase [Abditibacteriaceae bacterium]
MSFPKEFVWGAAAASYQIEGAAREDGKGLSVWDMLCRKPGAIWSGHSGDVACDHYHRYPEDIGLMQQIGLYAYRLSLSWPRIMPDGVGTVNDAGLAFYDRLIDALLAANITPYVTLFHWDYPYELYCRGGWLNRDSSDWFAEYTAVVVDKLSDRVRHWMTLNEPQCFIGLGHSTGEHAPGVKLPFAEVLRAGHNSLLAHGKAVQTIRAHSKQPCEIGYAPVGVVKMPASDAPEDIEVARQAMFSVTNKGPWNNTWWMDPVILGQYPEDGLKLFGADVPEVRPGDLETICQPLDFFGTNIYQGERVKANAAGQAESVPLRTGHELTAFRWPVTPDALYWGPRFFWERYKLPIVITENGLSNIDWVSLDGQVHDPQRIDYTARHLLELERAGQDGVDIRGYFHWSLMDNFEWAEGYKERFGLIYVEYPTQQRILKDSAHWYAEVIKSNGAALK